MKKIKRIDAIKPTEDLMKIKEDMATGMMLSNLSRALILNNF